jgi:hypothetical protein
MPHRLGKTEEVSQQVVPYFGENRFRMYLGSFNYIISMSYTHYLPFIGLSSDLKTGGETVWLDDQGMVTSCWKGVRYPLVDSLAIMVDDRCLAVDWH